MVGCQTDEDCLSGLFCNTDVSQPYCAELNECDPANGKIPGSLICGANSQCINTVGSFNCSCNPGYANYVPWKGCVDINECASYLTFNCSLNTECFNVPGNYTCNCKLGYQGNPSLGCYDIDECKDPSLNSCNGGLTPYGFNTETFGGENVKYFPVVKSPDLFSIKVSFELATPGNASLWLCSSASTTSCYKLIIGDNLNTKFSLWKISTLLTFVDHTTTQNLAVSMVNFKTYWVQIQLLYPSSLVINAGSTNDAASISFTDSTNIISVGYIGLSTSANGFTAFWRNVRVGSNLQSCINNFGSYSCVDIDDDEYLAIGTGGTAVTKTDSSYLGLPSVVTKDMVSCSNHLVGSLSSIVSHGMASLDNWLFVCGGQSSYLATSSSVATCLKFDLNNNSAVWVPSTPLPVARQNFGMVTYKGTIIVMGGRNYRYSCPDPVYGGTMICKLSEPLGDVYKFSLASTSWLSLASMPQPTFYHCVVADDINGLIWSIGGTISASPSNYVYTYNIATNVWSLHSQLNFPTYQAACSMVTLKTGQRWLIVVPGGATSNPIQYWNFYYNTGWYNRSSSNTKHNHMRMISLTPYTVIAVAGNTYLNWNGMSQQNFFSINLNGIYLESGYYYLFGEMSGSAWTQVKRSYRALANCVSFVKYAAVGWGGAMSSSSTATYTTVWDVLLRSRSTSMMSDPTMPVRCDTALPDLSPAKMGIGITSIGYWLLVCGGYQYKLPYESTCNYLDTDQVNSVWTPIQSMPVARADFPLVTYGDAIFAIAGAASSSSYLNRVDRWTKTLGWIQVAPFPASVSMHCAVADEPYDTIYSLAGRAIGPYGPSPSYTASKYTVSTNRWTSIPSYNNPSTSGIACAISRRAITGDRLLLVTGGGNRNIYSLNLISGTSWVQLTSTEVYSWDRPKLVSVTPWEIYKMGGSCNSCPSTYG
jgi:hypothetical protein